MTLSSILNRITTLKSQLDALRPIDPAQERRIMQKFRFDWSYHSNAIEGNSLTEGETRAFLLHGITAHAKPFRDYLDIKGHHEALNYLTDFVRQKHPLGEVDIRELHRIMMVEAKPMLARTPDGRATTQLIKIGQYKSMPYLRQTSTGEVHHYVTPEETPAKMGDLMRWYRQQLDNDLHPLILAATFHYRFVAIHPFDDGNGRMARLLMNLILMQADYPPVIIQTATKENYLLALEQTDAGHLELFISQIGNELIRSLDLYLRGARGEAIDEANELDKKIAFLQKKLEASTEISPAKSQQVLVRWVDRFFEPFSTLLITQLSKFDLFFWSNRFQLLFEDTDGKTAFLPSFKNEPVATKITLLTQARSILCKDPSIQELVLLYQLNGFNRQTNQVGLQIRFHLHKSSFEVRYIIFLENLSSQNKSNSLYQKPYNAFINEEKQLASITEITDALLEILDKELESNKANRKN